MTGHRMRNVQQRLQTLERLLRYQPPPTRLDQIKDLALRQVPNDDLEIMIVMAADQKAARDRPITQRESEVLLAHNAVLEGEAQRMGFVSFADAERNGGG